jgi:hypothetical protein
MLVNFSRLLGGCPLWRVDGGSLIVLETRLRQMKKVKKRNLKQNWKRK